MTNRPVLNKSLDQVKREAKQLSKSKDISRGQAFEMLAKAAGFSSWKSYRDFILCNQMPPSKKRVYLHDLSFDDHVSEDYDYSRIRGISINGNGSASLDFRESMLNYYSETYGSLQQFRNRIEHDIREIISSSKNHMIILIRVYVSGNTLSLMSSQEDFFCSIVRRFNRVYGIYVSEGNFTLEDLGKPMDRLTEIFFPGINDIGTWS